MSRWMCFFMYYLTLTQTPRGVWVRFRACYFTGYKAFSLGTLYDLALLLILI